MIQRVAEWFSTLLLERTVPVLAVAIVAIAIVVGRLRRTSRRLERNVAERTRELARANADLRREVDERVRAETRLEAVIAELERKNAELEQFTSTVSHDLKSPLITISGFVATLERLAREGDIAALKSDVVRIEKAADRMRRLLDELLKLSRVGRVASERRELSLSEIADEAVELCSGILERRNVRVDVAPDLPPVWGDRTRLLEVMQNLIENAVKFMGDEPAPRIEVGAREDDGETVWYVRDNGIGIEPRFLERVFELFEQLETEAEGTGVGLALVKRILEVHGGRVWAESDGAGTGTTFCFAGLAGEAVQPTKATACL